MGRFELKNILVGPLIGAGHDVIDFGPPTLDVSDDYPDFVIPLAKAAAAGEVEPGIAVCGSGALQGV